MQSRAHHCELPGKSDLLFESSNKYGFFAFSKLLNGLQSWITIYENHPKCREYLISLSTLNREKRRFVNYNWPTIHPFSKLRFLWEIIMVVVYFIAFFVITFSISFIILDLKELQFSAVCPFIYVFCWIDIFINCVTGYYDREKDEIILDRFSILKGYFKSYMLIDIFTSLPYDQLTVSWRRVPETGPDNELIIATAINILPALKLTRYLTFRLYVKQIFLHFDSEDVSCQMFLTLIFCLYVIHWFACFCNVTHMIKMYDRYGSVNPSEDTWLAEIENKRSFPRYARALFLVLENFTGFGYGEIEPKSEIDIALCTLLMIFGRFVECYLIIMFLNIVADRKSSESKYEEIVNQLQAYARQKQLPAYMTQRLMAYYHYRFRNSYFREKKILSNLSDALRKEVVLHSCRRLVENVEIFQNLPNSVLTQIVINLKSELYLTNDMIIKAGVQGDCMFFLSSGTVAVLTPTGKEICYLKDGAHFGEVALLVQDQRRVASVIAKEVCEVYRLNRKDFRKCIAVHSDLFAKIERIATERMQHTVLIEEEYKHFMVRSSVPRESKEEKLK